MTKLKPNSAAKVMIFGKEMQPCPGEEKLCLCPVCLMTTIVSLEHSQTRFPALMHLGRCVHQKAGLFGLSWLVSVLRSKSTSLWRVSIERRKERDMPPHSRTGAVDKRKATKNLEMAEKVILAKRRATENCEAMTLENAFDVVAQKEGCSAKTVAAKYYEALAEVGPNYRDTRMIARDFLSQAYGYNFAEVMSFQPITADEFPRKKGQRGRPPKISKK